MVTPAVPLCLQALRSPSVGWLPLGFLQVPPFKRGPPDSPPTVLPFLSHVLPSHSAPFNIPTFQEALSDFLASMFHCAELPQGYTLLVLFSSQPMSLSKKSSCLFVCFLTNCLYPLAQALGGQSACLPYQIYIPLTRRNV